MARREFDGADPLRKATNQVRTTGRTHPFQLYRVACSLAFRLGFAVS